MNANDVQIGGDHYRKHRVQHWDWAADMPYLEGRATAYIGRHQDKGGLIDVEKGLHFIAKILEVRYGARLNWSVERTEHKPAAPYLAGGECSARPVDGKLTGEV